jgi:hypothetical protein
MLDSADLYAPLDQFGPGRLDIGHDKLQALYRSWCHFADSAAYDNGTGRAGRCQLDDAHFVVDPGVVVNDKANPFTVEMPGPIHVGHGHNHYFKLPIHFSASFRFGYQIFRTFVL